MDEYIRKSDIEQKAIMMYGFGENKYVPLAAINRIPAADVAPVVHGRWEKSDIPCEMFKCSVCGGGCWYYDYQGQVAKSRFCPNCGAKMDGVVCMMDICNMCVSNLDTKEMQHG